MHKKEVSDFKDNYIKWFSELGKNDVLQVGGKGANLGEMYNIGMPVPPGFVLTAGSYKYFLEKTGIGKKIYEILSKIDIENTNELDEAAKIIQKIVVSAEIPDDMKEEILDSYEALSFSEKDLEGAGKEAKEILKRGQEPVFVAVRSSATAEDSEKASFAGQQETYINVKGNEQIIISIKKCFASLFSPRSIYYRVRQGFKHETVLIAVVIQVMVNADRSGVIFSKDPVEMTDNVVIEAVYGLGEGIVSGRIKPDHYVVSRDLEILKTDLAEKKVALVRDSSGKTIQVKLTPERSMSQVLTKGDVKKLADYSLRLEEHYKLPQDIEFAIDSGKIYIVQTRPVTTLKKRASGEQIHAKEILSGQPASPGIGSGQVKIIIDLADLNKIVKGDILVTKMTNPDMVVAMQKSAGIVTEEGGATCHAAIISREMGIPAVVGTGNAISVLKDKQEITVDGFNGKVYDGLATAVAVEIKPIVDTQTKIKVTVDLPSFAERSAKTGCKAVGLLRVEGIIAESGMHPYGFIKENRMQDYEDIIYAGINKIGKYFDELWIRTSDVRSDEYRNLRGAPAELELNPMLGMHGIRAGLKYPEILKAELRAAGKLAEKRKVGIMMPQIISVDEVRGVKKLLNELKIDNLILGIMVETPAASLIIEELCKEGIKFVSFGTNDLTQFTLAIDRGNETVQYLYDEMHLSVLRQLASVIAVCKKYGVESSICGQAGSKKEMVEFLVKHGISSISVNADKAGEISEFVKELEHKGLRGSEVNKENTICTPHNKPGNETLEAVKQAPEIKLNPQEEYNSDFSVNVFEEQGNPPKKSEEAVQEARPEAVQTQQIPMIDADKIKELVENLKMPEQKAEIIEEIKKELPAVNAIEAPVEAKTEVREEPEVEAKPEEKIEQKIEEKIIEKAEEVAEKKLDDAKLDGVVRFFKTKGNYGFIDTADGKSYFAHKTSLKNAEFLNKGDKVMFKIEETERGPKAVEVFKLE